MSIKFTFHREYGLQIESESDDVEITQQEAMIVAVRDLAAGMGSLASALWEIDNEFAVKRFYDEDAGHAAPAPAKSRPPKSQTKRSSKTRR